ncbi:phage tail protein [Barnesiella sp. An55]|uniref:phage tail protein n=1 Tax=Barnesiella sp. An55 TaxID=1965646 RepID=UPI000B36693B|nr:phage tail protein [Barnesiella sp. An55]OUN69468.1 hypothetical protein B5G10_11355 [Barnesiella sp. An55]
MEQIIIKKPDGTEIPLFSRKNVSSVSKANQKTALLSDDVVSITVSSALPLDLDIGCVLVLYGKPYKLNQLPEPAKEGERRYTYELRFEGLQYDLIDVHYHLPEDAYGETYYSDLAGHLQVLMWNINRIFPGKWVLGTYPENTEYKNITNSGKNCLQVAQELCSDYGVEFEITTNGTTYTLNFKEKVGITHTFTLRYGRGKGLYRLERKNVNNAGIVTRLYVYGGTENLGRNYGHTRLCLPGATRLTSYIEDEAAIALYGVKEGEKTYDIKPQRVGTVTALGADVITFADNTMFDLNAKASDGKSTKYLIDGTSAKIKFESGGLAGYEFDLHSYDHATKTFVINKFQDENGSVFPSETSAAFQIAVGDKYSISDIQLPDEYIEEAEEDLEEEGSKYLPTVSQPQVSYKLELTEGFFTSLFGDEVETEILHVGDFIPIEDEQIGVNKAVRITQIERDLLKPHSYDITLSDTITKTTTVRVWNELQEINEVIHINKLADPAKARRRWKATQELLNMVFDPEGDYYSEKIKPLSIETQMLSVGAKSTQFTLQNITFQPNYGGNANTLYVSNGLLVHYAIDPDGLKYWILEGATYSGLTSGTAYYIYAKCPTNGTAGNIILSETAKTVDSEAGYYNFLIGVLNSVVTDEGGKNPGRLVSLTYGSSTINGRFIRTGRIESNAGSCYFDLDNNEIGGVIKFVKNDGSTGSVSDVDDKTNEVKDYINNTLPGILNEIQSQLDGQIEQFFYEYDPTTSNVPAKDWTTTQLKDEHLGDLFYNTATGKVFRWVKNGNTYSWQELQDSEVAQALALANDALKLAGTKRRIFVSTPTTPYDVGDLWVQGTTGDIMRCKTARTSGSYNASDWVKACKYTDDSGLTNFINNNFTPTVNNLTNQIDGKIESWFQTSDPAGAWTTTELKKAHVGDMWYSSTTKLLKRYSSSYAWVTIEDQKAIDAYEAASKAQDTADGKRRVFVSTPKPPYDIGDLWLTGGKTDGLLKRCITARASGSYVANDWVEAVYYDNTKTTIDGGIVTAGTVQLAGNDQSIKAGITGEGTADTSVRFWAGASKSNRATAPYRVLQDGSFVATKGTITGTIYANAGTIGGFEIASGRIGVSSSSGATSGSGFSLYGTFIKFSDSYRWASIGTNVLPASTGIVGVGRFTNNTPNPYGTNYGILINVSGANTNIGIVSNGAIVSNSYIVDYGIAKLTPSANNCLVPGDATKPTLFKLMPRFIYSNSGIGLPRRDSICTVLGISNSTAFAVRIVIICDRTSTKVGYVCGRNQFVKNSSGGNAMDSNYYPYRMGNNADTDMGKWNMAKGDIREFLLVWDGSSGYYAYLLNIRE